MKNKQRHESAFTLFEILLVVIVIGIAVALAVPNFTKGYSRFQLTKTADDLLSMGRWAQAMAIGQSKAYALKFSDDRRSYQLIRAVVNDETGEQDSFEPVKGTLGRMHQLPESILLDISQDNIQFYPDGTIDEARVQLNSPEQKTVLSTKEVRGMMTKEKNE